MRSRSRQHKQRRKESPPKDDKPPGPLPAIAAVVVDSLATAGTAVYGAVQANKANKAQEQALKNQSKTLSGIPSTPNSALQVGNESPIEAPQLTPGQKANLINTSPQGLLDSSPTHRQTLLGG